MPHLALSDRRPYLLLGLTGALAFWILRATSFPELYLVPLKGFATLMLATYAFVRHKGPSARLLGMALVVAALGDMALEADRTIGGALFFLFHVMLVGLFLRHRRQRLAPTQTALVALLLLATPVIAYLLPVDRVLSMQTALYGLALGAMAAAAWASSFPRYRVGMGAMLFWLSDMLIFAQFGPLMDSEIARQAVYPIYFVGQIMICTGIIQTLRRTAR